MKLGTIKFFKGRTEDNKPLFDAWLASGAGHRNEARKQAYDTLRKYGVGDALAKEMTGYVVEKS